MLLQQEMKVVRRSPNTCASSFVAKAPAPTPPAGGTPPPSAGGGQPWRPPANHAQYYGGYGKGKIKKGGYMPPGGAPAISTPFNP
jgi:hypothetical protein